MNAVGDRWQEQEIAHAGDEMCTEMCERLWGVDSGLWPWGSHDDELQPVHISACYTSSHINKHLLCQQSKQVILTTGPCDGRQRKRDTYAHTPVIFSALVLCCLCHCTFCVRTPTQPHRSAHLSLHHSAQRGIGQFISLLSWHFRLDPHCYISDI